MRRASVLLFFPATKKLKTSIPHSMTSLRLHMIERSLCFEYLPLIAQSDRAEILLPFYSSPRSLVVFRVSSRFGFPIVYVSSLGVSVLFVSRATSCF